MKAGNLNFTEDFDPCAPSTTTPFSTSSSSSSSAEAEAERASSSGGQPQLQLNPALFLNVSVDELEADFNDSFSWSAFFRHALQEPANVTLTDALIHSHEYLRSLVDLLASSKYSDNSSSSSNSNSNSSNREDDLFSAFFKEPPKRRQRSYSRRTINNYLGWATVAKYMPYLGAAFRHLSADFQAKSVAVPVVTASGSSTSETQANTNDSGGGDSSGGGGGGGNPSGFKFYNSRWKQCVYIACESLKVPAISLYISRHRPPDQLERLGERIGDLIERMKRAFLAVIDRQPWLGRWPAVRAALKRRVASISANIGVPEQLRNGSHVEALYRRLEVNASAELISNVFAIARHESVLEARKLLEAVVSPGGEWLFQPLDANAFYDFTSNDISKREC